MAVKQLSGFFFRLVKFLRRVASFCASLHNFRSPFFSLADSITQLFTCFDKSCSSVAMPNSSHHFIFFFPCYFLAGSLHPQIYHILGSASILQLELYRSIPLVLCYVLQLSCIVLPVSGPPLLSSCCKMTIK